MGSVRGRGEVGYGVEEAVFADSDADQGEGRHQDGHAQQPAGRGKGRKEGRRLDFANNFEVHSVLLKITIHNNQECLYLVYRGDMVIVNT